MTFNPPKIGKNLTTDQIALLEIIAKSCRHSILAMTTNAQSGHPGGSLSSIDFLTLLYTFIICQTGESVIVSNGHISPAVYAILAECGYINKQKAIETFRKIDSLYEGHITRHVRGVLYGTGPLGIGSSVAAGFALAKKLKNRNKKVFCVLGDGECQEGEVYEMMNFSRKYKLDNLIFFLDHNKIQLTDSLEEIMPMDFVKIFKTGGFEVIEVDAHNFQEMWKALGCAYATKKKPTILIGHSIMGKGIDFMEQDGIKHTAVWHGKAAKKEEAEDHLQKLQLTPKEQTSIINFCKKIKWAPPKPLYTEQLTEYKIDIGKPFLYTANNLADCRTAYGKALLDLAKRNPNIIALTADLRASVMTKFVAEELPNQHIECGIAEQHMLSLSGGLAFAGFIPFCSTFGAFMTSRAKDQARVNDINCTNVKMVATHCGLSVGEDGPTHQAIDDMGSFLGLLNTMIIEPADPNQTDHIIRYIASHYGNFYIRMGRHKFPIILKEDGSIFYDEKYKYEYGKTDLIRKGNDLTIAATGAMIGEAIKAQEVIQKSNPNYTIEIIAVSSIKKFDQTLINSITKTQNVLTIEDHNTYNGLGSQLARYLMQNSIHIQKFKMLGVEEYQLSGTAQELYKKAGLDAESLVKSVKKYYL